MWLVNWLVKHQAATTYAPAATRQAQIIVAVTIPNHRPWKERSRLELNHTVAWTPAAADPAPCTVM
jgi:hypothetical protein